jgi:cytidylate kinase
VGSDNLLEEVTLRNNGTVAVSLAGWRLQDSSGGTWMLTGSLAPSQSRVFLREGQTMSLNNAGDEIALRDAGNVERDRFEYGAVSEGMVVNTQH